VLGNNRFKQQIEQQVGRPVGVLSHGGDRKSAHYKEKRNQQPCPLDSMPNADHLR
jgi:hypothetical protein